MLKPLRTIGGILKMSIRPFVEELYAAHTAELKACPEFQALLDGSANREEYDRFIANVIRTHLRSPQFLAYLLAIAPPASQERVKHNLLEELGIEDEHAHPDLLKVLAKGAGLDHLLPELESLAQEMVRDGICQRLLFPTLRDQGLAMMLEVFSFEWMLSRTATSIANALQAHRQISREDLEWFTHHSELDIRHAEEALDTLDDYVDWYKIDLETAQTIAEMATRENLFIKRYFGELSLARQRGMVTE